MANFSQEFIRSVIWCVWDNAQDGAETFYDAIAALKQAQWTQNSTGFTVQNSSGAGYSTSFHIPASPEDQSSMTPMALQSLCQKIHEYYAKVISCGTKEDNAKAGMSPFVAALCAFFPTIKGYQNNFNYARP